MDIRSVIRREHSALAALIIAFALAFAGARSPTAAPTGRNESQTFSASNPGSNFTLVVRNGDGTAGSACESILSEVYGI